MFSALLGAILLAVGGPGTRGPLPHPILTMPASNLPYVYARIQGGRANGTHVEPACSAWMPSPQERRKSKYKWLGVQSIIAPP